MARQTPESTAAGTTGSNADAPQAPQPPVPDTLEQLTRAPNWGIGGSYVLDPATGERTPSAD